MRVSFVAFLGRFASFCAGVFSIQNEQLKSALSRRAVAKLYCLASVLWCLACVQATAATCSFPLSQSYGDACTDLLVSSFGSISNGGDISNVSLVDAIENRSTIVNLTNTTTGKIQGVGFNAISNFSIIMNLTNEGEISSDISYAIYNAASRSINVLNNSGEIKNTNNGGDGILNEGSIGSLINSKIIQGDYAGVRNDRSATISIFNNQVGGSITGGQFGVALYMGVITNFTNHGSITGGSDGIFISSGTISNLNNSGSIIGTANAGIQNLDSFTLNNSRTISGGVTGIDSVASGATSITNNDGGVISGGSIGISSYAYNGTSITNNLGGEITGAVNGVKNSWNLDYILNDGHISGTGAGGIGVFNDITRGVGPTISTLTNSGSITGLAYGVYNDNDGYANAGTITTLTNSGTIAGGTSGVYNTNVISTLTNSGSITGTAAYGVYNYNDGWGSYGSISTLTNSGSISGGTSGVRNDGVISTLINYQGGDSSFAAPPAKKALTYEGVLPSNYYIYISSTSHYGQVVFSNVSGSMTFGMDASPTFSAGTYYSVLKGLDSSLLNNTTGYFTTYKWTLSLAAGVTDTWNLEVAPNSVDPFTIKPISHLANFGYSGLRGGTIQVDAPGTYSADIAVDASSTNTIDAAGSSATLSGVLSDATTLGSLVFSDSVGGGMVTLTGVNTYRVPRPFRPALRWRFRAWVALKLPRGS